MNLAKRSVLMAVMMLPAANFSFGQGAFISHIPAYVPAPGQYINDPLAGTPEAASHLMGGMSSLVSLGAWGGYLVAGFDHTILNDPANPYGIDFTIFGNAFDGSAEPGIVRVMKDENGNGLPDDTWYEIAGSRHYTRDLTRNYRITYYHPAGEDGDIAWADNLGDSGYIFKNNFHLQPYYPLPGYFPGVNQDSISFSGSRIYMPVSQDKGILITPGFLFGYADCHPVNPVATGPGPDNPYTPGITEGTGGDAFDISWAVDGQGRYVDLSGIDFIMIQTAVNAQAGPLGEISAEIRGISDVAPDPSLSGETRLISLETVPEEIPVNSSSKLEPLYFQNGRPVTGDITLTSSDPSLGTIVNGYVLEAFQPGTITLQASLAGHEEVNTSKTIRLVKPASLIAERNFGYLLPDERGVVSFRILDQDGNTLDGVIPEFVIADTAIAMVAGVHGRQAVILAGKAGTTVLKVTVPGMDGPSKELNLVVIQKLQPADVSVSVKMGSRNILPRKNYRVGKTDVNPFVENNVSGNLVSAQDDITLADVLSGVFVSEGFTGGEKAFRFRKDQYSGDRLYLWQVGTGWEYFYGWGGNHGSQAYSSCWTVTVNDTLYLSDFDHVRVYGGSLITVNRVDNILSEWSSLEMWADRQVLEPGGNATISYKLNRFSPDGQGGIIRGEEILPADLNVYFNGNPEGTIGQFEDPAGGSMTLGFESAGTYLVTVEGYAGEVLRIDAGGNTGFVRDKTRGVSIFPNPFHDYFNVDAGNCGDCIITVTDMGGRVLYQGRHTGQGELRIGTADFKPGLYILGIRSSQGAVNRILIRP